MTKKENTCFICGRKYPAFCPTCRDFNPVDTWKYLYDDLDCVEISKIWYAYRGNEISKEKAKAEFRKYPNKLKDILNNSSIAALEIRAIFAEENPVKKESAIEETDNKTEDSIKTAEETPVNVEEPKNNVEEKIVKQPDAPKKNQLKKIEYKPKKG